MFTAFFVPCSCQSLDTYKLASYIHSYHLPFGELRNWQYSHSVALSGHRTGELLSSRSLDSNTSSVLKTCVSPVPTEEESLKSCADEFPAIFITWPIVARKFALYIAPTVERSLATGDDDGEQDKTKEDTKLQCVDNLEVSWWNRKEWGLSSPYVCTSSLHT